MRKIRTWLAVPVLMAAVVVPMAAATGQAANAASSGNVVQPDFTCPAQSATASACLYGQNDYNDDYHLYAPNTGTYTTYNLYGVRNRNTVWYLCLADLTTGQGYYVPPKDEGDSSNIGELVYGDKVELWFHANATCVS